MVQRKKSSPRRKRSSVVPEIVDYDSNDSSCVVDVGRPLKFADIGLKLPETPPTQVVSIRIPSTLLNELRALGSQRDVPYQALIKLFLAQAVSQEKRRRAA